MFGYCLSVPRLLPDSGSHLPQNKSSRIYTSMGMYPRMHTVSNLYPGKTPQHSDLTVYIDNLELFGHASLVGGSSALIGPYIYLVSSLQ